MYSCIQYLEQGAGRMEKGALENILQSIAVLRFPKSPSPSSLHPVDDLNYYFLDIMLLFTIDLLSHLPEATLKIPTNAVMNQLSEVAHHIPWKPM
ncbi:MAG: hypothetical protein K0S01_2912 [Herbinix sp.]|nr:hypothetical protein [Herbinix sp.]